MAEPTPPPPPSTAQEEGKDQKDANKNDIPFAGGKFNVQAPPPFSLRAPTAPSYSSSPTQSYQPSNMRSLQPLQPQTNSSPQSSLQPLQTLQPTPIQPLQPLQPLQPSQYQPLQQTQLQPQQQQPQQQTYPQQGFAQQGFPQQQQQGFPPQQQQQQQGYSQQGYPLQSMQFPSAQPQPQSQSQAAPPPSDGQKMNNDQGQQILTKLQQLMNQMNSFMKTVDARLTTLEKMVQQVATVQAQQIESARVTVHAPPPSHPDPRPIPQQQHQQHHQQQQSVHPPPDFSRDFTDFSPSYQVPPPYLPDNSYFPDYRSPVGPSKTRQEIEDEELAKRLQQEFNMEAKKIDTKKAFEEPSKSTGMEECPICKVNLPLRDLELHVQSHLDLTEPIVRKPMMEKPPEEKSLWDRIFGGEEKPTQPQQPPAHAYQHNFYPGAAPGYGGYNQGYYYPSN